MLLTMPQIDPNCWHVDRRSGQKGGNLSPKIEQHRHQRVTADAPNSQELIAVIMARGKLGNLAPKMSGWPEVSGTSNSTRRFQESILSTKIHVWYIFLCHNSTIHGSVNIPKVLMSHLFTTPTPSKECQWNPQGDGELTPLRNHLAPKVKGPGMSGLDVRESPPTVRPKCWFWILYGDHPQKDPGPIKCIYPFPL